MAATSGAQDFKERGNTAFKSGKFEEAESLYTAAIQAWGSADAKHLLHGNRAAARLKFGNAGSALEDACAALELDPRWDKGWFRRAAALDSLGRHGEALAAAEQSVRCAGRGDAGPAAKLAQRISRQLSELGGDASPTARGGGGSRSALCAEAASQTAAWAAVVRASQGSSNCRAISSSGGPRLGAADVAAQLPPVLRPGHVFQHSKDGVDTNLLLLLHGLGDTAVPFAKLAKQLALPQTATLALPAPLPIPGLPEGRMWFEAVDAQGELLPRRPPQRAAARRDDSLAATLGLLDAALQGLSRNGGWPARRIHLLGFSQGGTAALHLAARHQSSCALGSCIAVSAALLPAVDVPETATAATPVLITHGDLDVVVLREDVERTVSLLNAHKDKPARLETFPKGHQMISGPAEARACMGFWARHLGAAPPQAAPGEEIVEVSR